MLHVSLQGNLAFSSSLIEGPVTGLGTIIYSLQSQCGIFFSHENWSINSLSELLFSFFGQLLILGAFTIIVTCLYMMLQEFICFRLFPTVFAKSPAHSRSSYKLPCHFHPTGRVLVHSWGPPRNHPEHVARQLCLLRSSADEMVSFQHSFAFNFSLWSLILSENIARPFLRISSVFGAMGGGGGVIIGLFAFELLSGPGSASQRIYNTSEFNTIRI